jgi:fibronectin-binding autotransporter adhesin
MSFNTTVSGILTANGLSIASGSVSLPAGSVTAASVSGLAAIATTGAASNLSGVLTTSNIPNLNASNINSGNFSVGTFGSSVVPSATGNYDLGSSTSNWRSAFLSSNLTVGGAITSTGAMTLRGTYVCSLPATFDTAANGVKDIATFTCTSTTSGQISFDISMILSQGSTSSTKRYIVSTGYNITNALWQRCIPISVHTSSSTTDSYELQMQSTAVPATIKFRLVHSVNTIASTPTVNITATYAQNDVPTFASLTGTAQYTDASWATYGFVSSTALTQVGGQVGVGTLAPSAKFHVSGGSAQFDSNVTVASALSTSNLTATGTVTLPSNSITSANISGVDASKITTGIFGVGSFGTSVTVSSSNNPNFMLASSATTNSLNLGMATAIGNYSASAAVGDVVLRGMGGKVLIQSSDGAAALAINTANKVGVGNASPLAQLHNSGDMLVSANTSTWPTTATKGLYMRYSTWGSQDEAYIQSVDMSSATLYNLGICGKNIALGGSSPLSAPTLYVGSNGNIGVGTTGASYKLDVSGTLRTTGAATLSSVTTAANSVNSMPGILAVNDGTDSGSTRGLRWWSSGDIDTLTYASSSGASKSPANATTCTSLDGRTSVHIRNRAYGSTGRGFLWENTTEQCLMSLTSDTGNLFVKGMYSASGTCGLLCTVLSNGRSLGSFLTTAALTGNANAPLYWTNLHSLAPLANIFNGLTTPYVVRIAGYINIQYAQQYTFYFNITDDATYVYVDGALVIAQNMYTNAQSSQNYTFASTGWKPLYIFHTQTGGGEALRLQWSTTGTGTIAQQDIPAASLAYDQSEVGANSLGGPLYYSDATYNVGIANTIPSCALDVTGGLRATNGLTIAGGTVSFPASSIAAAAISGSLATNNIPNMDASKITTGTFSVGAFGSTNVGTTGTLNCGNIGGGAAVFSSVYSPGTILSGGFAAPTQQGAYLSWNRSTSSGMTTLANARGTGGGGWEFVSYSGTNVFEQVAASIGSTGALTAASGAFSGAVSGTTGSYSGAVSATTLKTSASTFSQCTQGSRGFIDYSDGATYYMLTTSSGDSSGSFNSLRPFVLDLATGNLLLANSQVGFSHATGAMTGTSITTSGPITSTGLVTARSIVTNSGSNNVMPGQLSVNDQTDGGVGRGVRWWDQNDQTWATYMTTAGATKSTGAGTTCSSLDGRTSHHLRNRVGASSAWGFLWENASEQCLMSLTGDTGNLFIKGTIGSSTVRVGGTAYLNDVDCGNIIAPGRTLRSYTATFDTTANGVKDIVTFGGTTGSVAFDITVATSGSSLTMVKKYSFAAGYHFTTGAWRRCMPQSAYRGNPDEYELQISGNDGVTKLRLVHSSPTIASTVTLTLSATYSQGDVPSVTNTVANAQYTDANWATYAYASTTSITHTNSNVGIGTASPTCSLDFGQTGGNKQLGLYTSTGSWYGIGASNAQMAYQTGGAHTFYVGSTSSSLGTSAVSINSLGTLNAGAISCTGLTSGAGQGVSMPGIVTINDSTDSGASRGIHYWSSGDANWKGYMCGSGANKSGANGSACASLDGRTSYHIRNRAFNGSSTGFIWENSGEQCLMSLAGDSGNLFIKGGIGSSSVRVTGTAYLSSLDCGPIFTNNSNFNAGTGSVSGGAFSGTTNTLTGSMWVKRTFTVSAGPSYTTPAWYKLATFLTNGSYVSGAITVVGTLACVSSPVRFTANIGFHTQNPSFNASLTLDSADGANNPFASGQFDIALYVDNSGKALYVYAKQAMTYMTMSLDVTCTQFEGNGLTIYPSTAFALAYAPTNAQLMTADSTLGSVLSSNSFNTLCGSNKFLTKGSALTVGGSISGGIVTCTGLNLTPSGTGHASASTNYASALATGNFNVSYFGVSNGANNSGWYLFNNAGGSGSSSNYAAYGLQGKSVGTGSFNICANGNFGICTASPQYTLDVSGTGRYTGALSCGSLSTSGAVSTNGNFVDTGGGGIACGTIFSSLLLPVDHGTNDIGSDGNYWRNAMLTGKVTASSYSGLPRKYWNAMTQNVYGNSGKYYRIASILAASSGANGGSVHISGAIGGFGSDQMAVIDCTIQSRSLYSVRGSAYGAVASAKAVVDIAVVMEADSTFNIYIHAIQSFVCWDLSVEAAGTNVTTYEPTDGDVTPSANIVTPSVLSVLGQVNEYSTMTTSFNSFTYNGSVVLTGSANSGAISCGTLTSSSGLVTKNKTDSSLSGVASSYAYSAADNYPMFQQFNWTHDNIALFFDMWYNGSDTSASSTGSFGIRKMGGTLRFVAGVAAANSAVSTTSAITINTSAQVGINNTSPSYNLDVTGTARVTGALTSGNITCGTIGTLGNSISAGSIACTAVNPGTTASYDVGTSALAWRNQYFSGTRYSTGNAGFTANSTAALTPLAPYHMFANTNTDDNTLILGSTTTGAGLVLDDIVNAKWKMTTGGYNLNFYQQSSGTTSQYTTSFFTRRVFFSNTGQIYAQNTAIAAISSDERVKTNIRPIIGALDRICGMTGRIFDYKYPEAHNGDKNVTGFIAQEIEEDFPELSCSGEAQCPEEAELCPDGVKSYGIGTAFHANVVEAFKELRGQKDEEIQVLKDLVASLAARIAALENA